MNLVWSALVIAVAAALAVTAMLLVRRGAPEGSRFVDGDRASGVFGVLATGFSVLLGFVVFLAFESYDQSRAGAEQEALVLSQQVETAQFLGAPVSRELTGELVCYGRSVVYTEWPRAETGDQGDQINPWGVELFRTIKTVQPGTASEQEAYGKWMDQTSDREAARIDRIHGAVGVIPTPLWVVLLLISVVVFVFMLFFADPGEGAVAQAVLMGSVATVVVSMLLLIAFLDSPFHKGVGGVRPAAMERTLRIVDESLRAVGETVALPCDARGNAVSMTDAHKRDWVEVGATVLLAIAAVATAWSSYQATRWNGEQAKTSASVNKTRIDAARASDLANAQQQVDVETFMQWVDSYARGETELVDLLPRALPAGVQARVRRVGRDETAQDQGCAADAVRACRSTGWRRGRRHGGWTRPPRCFRPRCAGTSSGRRTTSSVSFCSRSRSSSPA